MQELATELNLSRTTVSLILKGESERFRISTETRDRVLEFALKHNFKPNYFASMLNTRRTGLIGLILPNVFESFMSELIRGMETTLNLHNNALMVSTSMFSPEVEKKTIEEFRYRGVDGLILAPYAPFSGQERHYDAYRQMEVDGFPHVFIDRYPAGFLAPRVVQNDFEAAYSAVRLLSERGCHHIGYIGFDIQASSIRNRRAGWVTACHDAGLSGGPEILLAHRDRNEGDLESALLAVLSSAGDRPDAFFISSNGLSFRVQHIIRMITGTDTAIQLAKFGSDPEYWETGMIQVRQPQAEMGRVAAELLLAEIDGQNVSKDSSRNGNPITIPTEIILPGSTGSLYTIGGTK